MRSILQIIYYILSALSVILFGCCVFSFPPQISRTVLSLLGIICALGNLILLVVISTIKEKPAEMKHAARDQIPVERTAETVMKHAAKSVKETEQQEPQEEFQEIKLGKILENPFVSSFMKRFVYPREKAAAEKAVEADEPAEIKEPVVSQPVFRAEVKPAETPAAVSQQAEEKPQEAEKPQQAAAPKPIMSFRFQKQDEAEMTNETQLFYQQTAELQDISNLREELQDSNAQSLPDTDAGSPADNAAQSNDINTASESDPESIRAEKYYEPLSDTQKQYIENSKESYLNTVGLPQLRITKTLENEKLRQEINRRLMVEKQIEEKVEETKSVKLSDKLNEDSEEFDLEKYERIDSVLNVIITVLIIALFGFGLFLLYRKIFG